MINTGFRNVLTVSVFSLSIVGCDWLTGGSSGTPAPPPPPTITGLDGDQLTGLDTALACVIGKTIKITGKYYTSLGLEIDINREADLTTSLFKVKTTGQDELAETTVEDPKVETWESYYASASDAGTTGSGINEVYCYDLEYFKGPFDGPDGQCSLIVKARICEDCTIESAEWFLMCGVGADGKGGAVKAKGAWTVE